MLFFPHNSLSWSLNRFLILSLKIKSSSFSCSCLQTSQDKDQEMVADFTVLWLKLKSHNIFNLRVEYIRPTTLTRFTCCHLPSVGGEVWGSNADWGKARTRQVHARGEFARNTETPPKHSCTLSYVSAALFTSLWLHVYQMAAPKQWYG